MNFFSLVNLLISLVNQLFDFTYYSSLLIVPHVKVELNTNVLQPLLLDSIKALELVYGPNLKKIDISSELLNIVLNKNHLNTRTSSNDGIVKIGCTSYLIGQHQVHVSNAVQPLLIDEQSDVMCFLVTNHIDVGSFNYLEVMVPDILKISPSLYSMIEGEIVIPKKFTDEIEMWELSISYKTINKHDFMDIYKETIALIKSYDIKTVSDRFLWTNTPPTTTTTTTKEKHTIADMKRFETWNTLFKDLSKHIASASSVDDEDPCLFHTILSKLHLQPDRILIQLPHKQHWKGTTLILAQQCLAFFVSAISQVPAVYHIDILQKPQITTYRSRSLEQCDVAGAGAPRNPYTNAGLTGKGQVISIADTGVDVTSCFFSDPSKSSALPVSYITSPTYDLSYRKVVLYSKNDCGDDSDAIDGHGTHVASIAAGSIAGASYYTGTAQYSGIAPEAKLAILDLGIASSLCIPATFADLITGPYQAGARIFSFSWDSLFPNGIQNYQGYDIDNYLYNHPDIVVLFAAGNGGQQGTGSISVQSTAKNIVSVGSSDIESPGSTTRRVAYYSSQGPTYDGRFKPDVIAPGDGLQSASSNGVNGPTCRMGAMTGTSSATPSAAGIAAMIRQFFQDVNGLFWRAKCNKAYKKCLSFTPSGVLLKTMLLHAGTAMQQYYNAAIQQNVPITSTPPDSIQGYGRIALKNVLPLNNVYTSFDLYVDDLVSIRENQIIVYSVQVQSSGNPFKVTIVWYDAPAVTGSTGKALINNLDLTVTSPSGVKLFGNGRTSPDVVNTNEQVFVASAAAGTWKVAISTKALPSRRTQLYSIAITNKGYVKQP